MVLWGAVYLGIGIVVASVGLAIVLEIDPTEDVGDLLPFGILAAVIWPLALVLAVVALAIHVGVGWVQDRWGAR